MQAKKPFKRGDRVTLQIKEQAFGGKGLARVATDAGDYVVFVPDAIAGQEVECQITRARAQYAESKLLRVLKTSPQEQELPFCPIPGAPYLRLPLPEQETFKTRSVMELYRRIAALPQPEELFEGFIASPRTFHYRNKMEYSFSAVAYDRKTDAMVDRFALGFKKRGQWLAVESLAGDSGLFDAQWESFVPQVEQYFVARGHRAWHSRKHEGFCRLLAVRKSFREDALLINFLSSSAERERFDASAFLAFLQAELGSRLGGLLHTISDDPSDRPDANRGEQQLLYGRDHLEEELLGLRFKISPASFFQTNPASAEALYRQAIAYLQRETPPPEGVVLDLFSGTGTIAQLLAQALPSSEVIGVELIEAAVRDARENARRNGIDNVRFIAADVKDFLAENRAYAGRIHSLVLDPPRAGIQPKALQHLIALEAQRIIYISCNPATQARDFAVLAEADYHLKAFSLVDQFPHTAHIESVALLEQGN